MKLNLKLDFIPFNFDKDAERYYSLPNGKMLIGLNSEGEIYTCSIGWRQGFSNNYFLRKGMYGDWYDCNKEFDEHITHIAIVDCINVHK